MTTGRKLLSLMLLVATWNASQIVAQETSTRRDKTGQLSRRFQQHVAPVLKDFCIACHNAEEFESGVRVDQLDGTVRDEDVELWKRISEQLSSNSMPPEDESQPSDAQRSLVSGWITDALHTAQNRVRPKNGAARRLTVDQYRNTIRELLGVDDDLTELLPPDAISKDGFRNNSGAMVLSPILVDAYFSIAEQMLDLCLVDENARPEIQNFRVDLGASINHDPCPDRLILGANSHLLQNQDFSVTELQPDKAFAYTPVAMQTKFRFHEGYQGNATVRGWRDYDSIYHAVFACMRGNNGYPKGSAYELVPEGLLLRPAIPSAEIFRVQSTYGPQANFKISLRQLPDTGQFRVLVRAAKYDDAMLLDAKFPQQSTGQTTEVELTDGAATTSVSTPGIYRIDLQKQAQLKWKGQPDSSRLGEGLMGSWSFDRHLRSSSDSESMEGKIVGESKFVDSPFGQALTFDGKRDSVVVPRNAAMDVGDGDFTVAAWIRPSKLQQGGIVCLGKYSWTHGWYLDMPNNRGVLRIETVNPGNMPNGTVASRPGVIRAGQWQHVAAVVRRNEAPTQLFVNGYQVGSGAIAKTNLDNPSVDLHIGRIQDSKLFAGEIDEPRIYRRALKKAEILALVAPGAHFVKPPPPAAPQQISLRLGGRQITGVLHSPAFAVTRLAAGSLDMAVSHGGQLIDHVSLTRIPQNEPLAEQFIRFENRVPSLGVHVGLRRDCGSTLASVSDPQQVRSTDLQTYQFEGAIDNFPSPETQTDNDNYLAGIREIGVRNEYTDGREAPRLLIHSVEFEGPYYESWPPASHRNIFIESNKRDAPEQYARKVISRFATRAFRRPIEPRELASLMSLWRDQYATSSDFQESIRNTLVVVLTSPQFLFLVERSASPAPEPLAPFELASKLSFFLWNGPPDATLLNLAASESLHESLDAEVTRMIQDKRFERFSQTFVRQWLDLDKFDVVDFDRQRFPALTRDVRRHLREEPVRFVEHLIRKNLPVTHLVQSDFIVADEVIASYYGLGDKTESGFDFTAIPHGQDELGGLLSQAAILAGLSDGRSSHPIKRGAWLARKIIAEPPDDPPPNVPQLSDGNEQLTLREQLQKHRDAPGCANCHAGIDPWGLPLEQFDAAGIFQRDTPRELTELPDGTSVDGVAALKSHLATARQRQVAVSFVKHLATYAIGRTLTYNEMTQLRRDMGERDELGMQDLLRYVVHSAMFLEK